MLLRLPDELVLAILEQVGDVGALVACGRVCRRLRALAGTVRGRTVLLDERTASAGAAAAVVAELRRGDTRVRAATVAGRPRTGRRWLRELERVATLRELTVEPAVPLAVAQLARVLETMPQLRALTATVQVSAAHEVREAADWTAGAPSQLRRIKITLVQPYGAAHERYVGALLQRLPCADLEDATVVVVVAQARRGALPPQAADFAAMHEGLTSDLLRPSIRTWDESLVWHGRRARVRVSDVGVSYHRLLQPPAADADAEPSSPPPASPPYRMPAVDVATVLCGPPHLLQARQRRRIFDGGPPEYGRPAGWLDLAGRAGSSPPVLWLTDLRLENLALPASAWSSIPTFRLPCLQVFSYVALPPELDAAGGGRDGDAGTADAARLTWVAHLWDTCEFLAAVRVHGLPGIGLLDLPTRRTRWSATRKRVLDLGWSIEPPSTALVRALGPASASPKLPFALGGLRWLRLPTHRAGIHDAVLAVGRGLACLDATVPAEFGDADVHSVATGAPGLRRLGLVCATGLAVTRAGLAHLAALADLGAVLLVGLPAASMADVAALGAGAATSPITHLALASVGVPGDSTAAAGLAALIDSLPRLQSLFVVQPMLHVSVPVLAALSGAACLRKVGIEGYQVGASRANVAAFLRARPDVDYVRIGRELYANDANLPDGDPAVTMALEQRLVPPYGGVLRAWRAFEPEPDHWWEAG